MDLLAPTAGVVILLLLLADVARTAMTASGAGWLSSAMLDVLGRSIRALHRGPASRWIRRLGGPLALLLCFAVWFALLWLGWTLVFSAAIDSIQHSSSGAPADLVGRIYFVGFTIITLGVGDLVPGNGLWQVLTVVASASGFFLVTMVISYTLSMVSALVARHGLAEFVHALGDSPQEIAQRALAGERSTLDTVLVDLHTQLQQCRAQHLAYPLLHQFHAARRSAALAPALARLNDALLLIDVVGDDRQRPSALAVRPLLCALDGFLETLRETLIEADGEPLPDPSLPTDAAAAQRVELEHRLRDQTTRRRLLRHWMEQDGWEAAGS